MTVENPNAFPFAAEYGHPGACGGMTLRDYFAGQALTNAAICTGTAPEYDLTRWFGRYASGITRAEIVARQAGEYADAMLSARQETRHGD